MHARACVVMREQVSVESPATCTLLVACDDGTRDIDVPDSSKRCRIALVGNVFDAFYPVYTV